MTGPAMLAMLALTASAGRGMPGIGAQGAQAGMTGDATTVHEAVAIARADGGTITGRFVRAGDGRRGAVLFSMCSSNAIEGWRPLMAHLASAGISSVAVTSPTPRPLPPGPAGEPRTSREADVDTVVAALAARLAPGAVLVVVVGGSCGGGVHLALLAATRHPRVMRAAVVLSGPYPDSLRDAVADLPEFAVFSGASQSEGPAIGWAQSLRAASRHPASRVLIRQGTAHGTDMFAGDDALVSHVTTWIAAQLP